MPVRSRARARVSHQPPAAPSHLPAPAALRSVGLLDVLHEYACGALGRAPCIHGHLRQLATKAGGKRGLAVSVVSIALVALLVALVPDGGVAAATGPEAAAPGARFAAGSANLARIWWNQPRPVELLGLSDEQRQAMDALLIDHLGRRRELARESLEIRRTLGERLAAGDWKAVEEASAELGERASTLARGDVELTLAVVRLLDPAQRRTLDQELPMILRRPWIQGGVGARAGRLGRPATQRRPPGESPGGSPRE